MSVPPINYFNKSTTTQPPSFHSKIENLQRLTATTLLAKESPQALRILIQLVGDVALTIFSMATLGFGLYFFAFGVWQKMGADNSMENLAIIGMDTPTVKLAQVPNKGIVFTSSFCKISPNQYRLLVEAKKTKHIHSIIFTYHNDCITCSNPEFMKGSLPDIRAIRASFSERAPRNKKCEHIGYKGNHLRAWISARNSFYEAKEFFNHTLPKTSSDLLEKASNNKLLILGTSTTLASTLFLAYIKAIDPSVPIRIRHQVQIFRNILYI